MKDKIAPTKKQVSSGLNKVQQLKKEKRDLDNYENWLQDCYEDSIGRYINR